MTDAKSLLDILLEENQIDAEEAAFLRTLPHEATKLVANGLAIILWDHQHEWNGPESCKGQPHGRVLALNMSDTFLYACADGEGVPAERVGEVYDVYKKHGPTGLICWAAKQRDLAPVIEYTEDPVYQATWKAMYGDFAVKENPCKDRWSDDSKLNLKPWEPIL